MTLVECRTAAEVRELAVRVHRNRRRRDKPLVVVAPEPQPRNTILDAKHTPNLYDWSFWYDAFDPQKTARVRIKTETIQRLVGAHYKITLTDLISHRRMQSLARPRQVAMYLCRLLTTLSMPQIGLRFGGRDHTTVLHAIRKLERLHRRDEVIGDEIDSLIRQLDPNYFNAALVSSGESLPQLSVRRTEAEPGTGAAIHPSEYLDDGDGS